MGDLIIVASIIGLALIVFAIYRRFERHIHETGIDPFLSGPPRQPPKRRPF